MYGWVYVWGSLSIQVGTSSIPLDSSAYREQIPRRPEWGPLLGFRWIWIFGPRLEAVPVRRLRLWGEVSLTVRLKKGLWRLKVPNGCSHSFVTWFTKVCYHRGSPERRLYSVLVLCWVQVFFFFNLVLCDGLREEGDKFTRCLSALVRVGCIWRSQIWIIGVSMCKHCRALGNLDLGENVLLGRFLL